MNKFYSIIIFLSIICSPSLFHSIQAQGISVTTTGADPDESAAFDIQSDSKGVLIPRLTTVQREGINPAAVGLLVYDTNTSSFWYRLAANWIELTDNFHGLRDQDNDTKIQVEESADEDVIRFDIGNVEAMVLNESSQNATRLDIGPDPSLIIGRDAGLITYPGWNTILGPNAGEFNTTGDRNVFVGYSAGQNNGNNADRNVFVGYEAGHDNLGGFNTMVGYHSGEGNTTGSSNSFYGYQSGIQNTIGYRNTFIGQTAGHNNEEGFENTIMGFAAGYYNEGNRNTFVGLNAGMRNRTGDYNVVVGARAAGLNLNSGNMGNGNVVMGYEAAYSVDSTVGNTIIGHRAATTLDDGNNNTLVGSEAGYLLRDGYGNVGIGVHSLRSNRDADFNVAVGDSALFENLGNGNVAIGSKAGLENTNGTGNTFIGRQAGVANTTGDGNTFLGNRSGSFNKTGENNVFIGQESGNANDDGNFNTFAGFAAGFNNDGGSNNVFLGTTAAQYNLNGMSNVAIGQNALATNTDGNFNIAIGEQALGDLENGAASIYGNIAIGLNAARNAGGTENIVIGNESGIGMIGIDNVLIGNDILPLGMNNTFLGSNTSANIFGNAVGATAVGYGSRISQAYSVILGDVSNDATRVGIGINTPNSKLSVRSDSLTFPLTATVQSNSAFRVDINRGVSIGTFTTPPVQGIRVQGDGDFRNDVYVQDLLQVDNTIWVNTTAGKPGYHISVDGRIACEEVLVENSLDWPDYVFEETYNLMPISKLREYLKSEKHLPGIPSAQQVSEEGVKLGEMQTRLLEKIEELTLYIVELETRVKDLESK